MRRVANAQVMRRLVCASTQISRVVPQHVDAHVHTRGYHVPQIPFAQQDAITMELGDRPADSRRGARNPCRAVTSNRRIGALRCRMQPLPDFSDKLAPGADTPLVLDHKTLVVSP